MLALTGREQGQIYWNLFGQKDKYVQLSYGKTIVLAPYFLYKQGGLKLRLDQIWQHDTCQNNRFIQST